MAQATAGGHPWGHRRRQRLEGIRGAINKGLNRQRLGGTSTGVAGSAAVDDPPARGNKRSKQRRLKFARIWGRIKADFSHSQFGLCLIQADKRLVLKGVGSSDWVRGHCHRWKPSRLIAGYRWGRGGLSRDGLFSLLTCTPPTLTDMAEDFCAGAGFTSTVPLFGTTACLSLWLSHRKRR